jgi:hypothetical protein
MQGWSYCFAHLFPSVLSAVKHWLSSFIPFMCTHSMHYSTSKVSNSPAKETIFE